MIHRIVIPNWRPARDNELINCHWRTKHKRKSEDAQIVAAYCREAEVPHALDKRRVSLEIRLTAKQKEADPLAYCKSLLDALVNCRMLIDDKAEFMEWGGVTYSRGKPLVPGTTIILEDME